MIFRQPPTPHSNVPHEDEQDEGHHREMSTNDLFIKDAFLVFRALCKLTMKPLNQERYVVPFLHKCIL